MKGTWKILKQSMNKGNNATTCIDSIVLENQTITDRRLTLEIFSDHFVNIGEKFSNKIDEAVQTLLKMFQKQKKGSLLKPLKQTSHTEPYPNLKTENQLEWIIFQTRL